MLKKDKKYCKELMRIYDKISNTPYRYLNSSLELSSDELLLIEITCKDLKDKDGEIDRETLQLLWLKIKKSMKQDIQKGHHKNKLLQVSFIWNIKKEYFSELTLREEGLFKRLLELYQRNYEELPTETELNKLIAKVLYKYIKI